MENLETKLINIINKFTRFQEFLNNLENREKFSEIKIRLSSAKPLLEQFESLYENITSLNPEKANTYDMLVFEDNYYATIGLADEILDFGNNKANESVESIKVAAPQVKLPSISLPKFSGKYTEWPTFYDTFTSVIDQNVNLSNLEKFQYLKSCLTDEASNVISSILISNDNYSSALNILKSRFENKRLIIQHHLNAIFNLPNITKDLKSLRLFIDTLIANLNSLKQLGRPTKYWDDIIIYLINTKFDLTTKNAWESETSNITIPSMNDMEIFLNKRCQTLEAVAFHSNNNKSNTNNNLTYKTHAHVTTNQKQLQSKCALCKNAHIIYQCTKFLSMTLNERINTVKTLKLCYNCLRENHSSNRCFSRGCKQYLKRHHTLLHDNNQTLKHDNANQPINNSQPSTSTTLSTNAMQRFNILLPTALIKTFDKYGNPITLRAILDSGSQSSFLTSKAFKKLGLPFKNIHCNIKGIAQTTMKTSKLVSFKIYSCISNFNASISCFIIPKISDNIPSASFSIDNLNIPNSIQLADPKFYVNDEIDLLIGNEIFWNLLSNGQISLGKNKPTLQSTHLGWILAGAIHLSGNRIVNPSVQCNFANYSKDNIQYSTNEQNFTTHHKCESGGTSSKLYNLESPNIFYNLNSQYNTLITNNDLHKQVECFWKLEEIQGRVMSHEEQECENHFLETHKRNKDGRFVVELPLRSDRGPLGNSYENAVKRFLTLERRLNKNIKLKNDYSEFIKEYEIVEDTNNLNNQIYYIPHHSIEKKNSLTTKLRVVFDASCKTDNNLSLNNILKIGPVVQNDLISIILRFRLHKYALTADICKMYRQILITNSQRDFQRIVWRSNPNEKIKHYRLNTVTYGTGPASFLATRCLKQLALENAIKFPRESEIILHDFYMDDLLTGADNILDLQKLKTNIEGILSEAGFELRQWTSNDAQLLHNNSKNIENYIISDKENQKTLGISWNTRADNLSYGAQFNLELGSQQVPTKRLILSKIAQIFDPLGLLGPIITRAKLIMQQLWQLKLGWDDCIPDDLYSTWNSFYSQLNILNSLHIPRRVLITSPTKIEMHGFCDASERAYGACVYLRSFNEQGEVKTTLLCSKSRVAPLKSITIPRLELCIAVLLCNLMKKVKTALNININETFYWTDSTIVLHWISSQSYDFKVFVSHRIAQIQTLSEPTDWYHVLSTENPADIISRGINPTMLNNCDLWWSGPLWLKTNDQLPIKDPIHSKFINFEISERKNSTLAIHTSIQSSFIISSMITKYSSLTKLIRVVAYLLKFINHLRSQSLYSNNKFLSTIDLHKAQLKIFQTIQEEEFAAEINAIKQGQLPKSSKLISLNPFIDKDGLLRVGGRLRHANVSFETKHPILISKSHPIVNLIIIYYHLKYLHSGSETTLAAIRQKFWIISGRSAVRQVLNRCVNCFKVNPSPAKAIMGDLPEVRVQSARPFLYCGVDYAGPIYIKEKLGRGKRNFKAYIVLFKCLSSKAVHIELVTDCTADTFLNALKRFMARRGKVYHIYSDNATTFVGADHELKKLKNLALSQEFKPYLDKLANDEITWHFIPPRSPNFGGIWESGIKGIKFHLKRIIGNSILTYEEMYTSLTLIESCINSRPLIPMSNDPTDYTALTPNHFLIGEQLTSPPEPNYLPCNHLSRFQLLEKLRQQFWRRWKREYLVQLQQRVKWKNTSTNLKIGELVLISDDNSPPLQWPLGRVIEVYPGADNVVRVALIKTKTDTAYNFVLVR